MSSSKRTSRDQALEKELQATASRNQLSNASQMVFLRSTAHEIVANIERRTWTASQVLEAFVAQSLVAHSETNCITEVLFGYARKRAKELDAEFEKTGQLRGPLHGVPISVKGSVTHPFVQSMLDAGAVPFVKTNVPQTMFAYECDNPVWGRTENPYNAAYSSGGSLGGEACMLSLDASIIGLGSDIGGSLRIPAAYCGVYSLKPGFGRISDCGAQESFPGFDGVKSVCGPMARCMDDLELACRIAFGAPGAYNDFPPLQFRDVKLVKKLHFGYYTSDGIMKASPASIHLTPEILKAYHTLTSADGYRNLLREKGSDPLDASLSVLTFGPKVPRRARTSLIIRSAAAWIIDDKDMTDIVRLSGSRTVEEYHITCSDRNELKEILTILDSSGWYHHVYSRLSPNTARVGIFKDVWLMCVLKNSSGSKMLSIMSAAMLAYNLVDSPCGVVPVTRVDAETDGPGHRSSMAENKLYFKGKTPLYDPVAMDGMPIVVQIVGKIWEGEKVLAMMRIVDEALGKARGFGPGSWEERLQNRGRRT
ncbi:amidase [Mycena maculata]|uniref:Amidase n=1 Tax=Mycena maculata TaxID=230809 RepID=A0AAD7IB28_9AGAR|nr:amidase [Mycena maculata]